LAATGRLSSQLLWRWPLALFASVYVLRGLASALLIWRGKLVFYASNKVVYWYIDSRIRHRHVLVQYAVQTMKVVSMAERVDDSK
jgi:hypothetical protein